MKVFPLLLLGLGLSTAAKAQTWTQIWSDEFNGPTLDQTKWSYETGTGVNGNFGTGQLDRATDRPENVAIEQGIAGATGGALRISTRKERYQDRDYTSGRINTKDKAFWGPNHRIVARVWPKGVRTKGQGFAFWMMGNEHPANVQELTWPQLGEIDIMEYVGAIPNHNLGTVHYAWYYNNNQYQDGNHGQHGAYYSFADKQTPDAAESFRVDLGALYNVSHVTLNWENNGKNYNLETSTDGTTWQPAYATTSGPTKGVADVNFAARSARFVRLNGVGRTDDYGYSLYELQVFEAGGTTNLALGKKVQASSSQGTELTPEMAVDGKTATRWSSAPRNPGYLSGVVAGTTDPNGGNNGWHEYGIDWFDDRMEFFVDNNVYHIHYFNDGAVSGKVDGQNEEALAVVNGKRVKKSEYSNLFPEWHPFEHKMYAILSAGVGGADYTYGGPITGQPAVFPADVYVDWMRVFSNGKTFNPPPTALLTGPTGADTYSAPGTVTLSATAADTEGGSISKVEFFNGTTLLGTATTAPYTFNWTNVPAGNYNVTAKATDNGGATSSSKPVLITVNGPTSNLALNRPGTATSTLSGQSANRAFDADLGSKWESLHADPTATIYVDLGNTYDVNRVKILWEAAFAENYDLKFSTDKTNWTTAKSVVGNATTTNDITGLAGKARYVGIFCLTKHLKAYGYAIYNVEVYGAGGGTTPTNAAPTVSLTAPAASAAYAAPATINLAANAADSDGSVSKVEFYNGTTLLGTDNTAPYTYSWTNVAAGSYAITAKATDNGGATTTSAAVAVTVTVGSSPTAGKAIPGKVEAESFDAQQGIQTEPTADTGGGLNVSYIDAGDYLDYKLTAAAGYYTVEFRVASWIDNARFDVQQLQGLEGVSYLGTVTLPNTGGGQKWQTVSFALPYGLAEGNVQLRLVARTGGFNLNWLNFIKQGSETVTTPPAVNKAIPGKVEAESFDAQQGIRTEPTADAGGGLNVSYIDAGDYLDYKLTAAAGYYTVEFRVASWIDNARFDVQQLQGLEGVSYLGTVTLPNTGGGQKWQTVSFALPYGLAEGNVNLRLVARTGGFNLNWLNFIKQGSQAAARTAATSATLATDRAAAAAPIVGYPNPVTSSLQLQNAAEGAPVSITDLTGRAVLQTTVRNGAVAVDGLSVGTYLVLIKDGKTAQRLKITKQ